MLTLKIDDKLKQDFLHLQRDEEVERENAFVTVLDENKFPLKLVLDVEALGPIYVSEFGHSVFCKIVNSEQYARVAAIEDLIDDELDKSLERKPFLNDDSFFLKLPVKNGKYKASFDIPINPDEPEKSNIKAGTAMVLYVKPGVWINYPSNKAGVFFSIDRISVDTGKKKSRVSKK
jgi:hypothetical protein